MLISIIIPLYNKEASIKKTIQSVTRQSFSDYEIVIVDDGSTDNSLAVVRGLNYPQIKIICQDNGGPSKARNTGVENAQGEWIFFLDADDELLPGAFEQFLTLLQKYPDVNCFAFNFNIICNKTKRKFYAPSRTKVFKNPLKDYCKRTLYPRTGAAFFHKNILARYKFDNQLRRYEDAEWIIRIMREEIFVRSCEVILLYQTDYAAASAKRRDIREDFLGHIDFRDKSIWEQVVLYQFLKNAFISYPEESKKLYCDIHLSLIDKMIIAVLSLYCNFIIKKNSFLMRLKNGK